MNGSKHSSSSSSAKVSRPTSRAAVRRGSGLLETLGPVLLRDDVADRSQLSLHEGIVGAAVGVVGVDGRAKNQGAEGWRVEIGVLRERLERGVEMRAHVRREIARG